MGERSMKKKGLLLALALLSCGKPGQTDELRYIIAPSGLNLRAQASPTSAAVKLLPYGTEVAIMSEQSETSNWQGVDGRWTKVKSSGVEGWAFGAFLAKERPVIPAVAGTWSACSRDVVNDGPLRLLPDGHYSQVSIGTLSTGTYVQRGNQVLLNGGAATLILQADGRLCYPNYSSTADCMCRQ